MARRKSRSTSASTSRTWRGYRKSDAESRAERITWALLVLVFALFQIAPPGMLPNWFIPVAGAAILLGSGMYQYSKRWRVSPMTWIAGTLMLAFALYNIYRDPTFNFLGLSLLMFLGVILFGLLTGET